MDGKQQYDSGLEPARQDFPEVSQNQQGYGYQLPQHQQHHQQPYQPLYQQAQQPQQPYYPQHPYDASAALSAKPEVAAAAPSTYGSQTVGSSPFSAVSETLSGGGGAGPDRAEERDQPLASQTLCGCSALVLILSCIIALLSAAVIGLAAATGVEAQRASSAQSSLAALNATATSSAPAATATAATATAVIDDGCSEDPASVNKSQYTSFLLLGALKFTRYCNKDTPHPPILSLFTADFDTCMDACAAYTKYVPGSFGGDTGSASSNTTCAAVSFIPAWTNKTTASKGKAPGNCYLKAGPQNATALTTPNIGTDCHAAVLVVGG